MDKIWNFFERLGEYVYVSDMDTYELIYMNEKARNTYGIASLDDLVGKKCYEVLQHGSAPCAICNNHLLRPGYFKEWQYYNPVIDKYLILKDSMVEDDGRRCRIELAFDINTIERRSGLSRNYQSLEGLINEGMRLALRASTPDQSIHIILEYLGKALKGERTYIFEKNEHGGDTNTYEWVGQDVSIEKHNLQDLPPEICAGWYQKFRAEQNVCIPNIEDIREDAPQVYALLKAQNIHSLVAVPLYNDSTTFGFYGIDNPPAAFFEFASNMLQIMGHFIVSCLQRRNLMTQLKAMSYRDQLTKIGNRYAMYAFISQIDEKESIGVVYCDVTGLKQVNDTQGHEAGDRLLVRACTCLKDVFGTNGLFRIGGDELLVLCRQLDEVTLWRKVDDLRASLKIYDVNLAVGAVWAADGSRSMDELMNEAERLMYADKAAYYKTSGIDRRRR